jgi:hypothetical protein
MKPAEQGQPSQPQAMPGPGKADMPGAQDPMTQATEAMRRSALEAPAGGEMPPAGMPEREVEKEGQEAA